MGKKSLRRQNSGQKREVAEPEPRTTGLERKLKCPRAMQEKAHRKAVSLEEKHRKAARPGE
jgi:hypothetical protein